MSRNAATLDLTKLANDLRRAQQTSEGEVQEILVSAGNQVVAAAQTLAPNKTGRLANSIGMQVERGRVTIGPKVKYGVFQEFGTGTRGEFPTGMYKIRPVRANKLAFKINGTWIFTKEVNHPGIKPRPYMRPAAVYVAEGLTGRVADIGVDLLMGKR